MADPLVIYEKPTAHTAVIRLNRPEKKNAMSRELVSSLAEVWQEVKADDEVWSIVLTGSGDAFCAGGDLGENQARARGELPSAPNPTIAGGGNYADLHGLKLNKPIIAAINGYAVGGGFGLAVMPDFRVVCPEARFTANFVKLGFHPGFGLTYTLPKLIGQQKANLMFMSGRRINGETAYEWGLADVLTDQENLRDEAMKLAEEIAENAPLAVVSVRATMRKGIAEAVKAQTDHEFIEQHRLQKTEDHKEGLRAVAERRPGNFKGR